VEAIEVEPLDVTHSGYEANDVRKLVLGGKHREQGSLGEMAVANLPPARALHRLVLTGAVGRHIVVVEIPLLGFGADRIDPLHIRGRAQRGTVRACVWPRVNSPEP